MTSLKARAAALEEDKKALEAELPHLRGEPITCRHDLLFAHDLSQGFAYGPGRTRVPVCGLG